MLFRECLREAWRNVVTGTSRAALLAVALGALLVALSLADALTVSRLNAQAQAYRSSGAAIRVATAPKAIRAEACEAFSAVQGVTGSGALREAEATVLTTLGGQSIPTFDVTRGLLDVIGASHADEPGVFVSTALSERWKVEPGDIIPTGRGFVTIAGVFPYPERDGRDPRLANAVLVPTLTTGRFDQCLAEVWPATASRDGLLRGTADGIDGKSGAASVSLLNESFGRSWQGSEDYHLRVTRFAPVAAALLGAVLGVGAIVRRRLEFAAALHAGVGSGPLAIIAAVECVMWSCAAALGALGAVSAVGVVLFRATLDNALVATGLTCASGALAAVAAVILTAATLRERHLFRHFKNRS